MAKLSIHDQVRIDVEIDKIKASTGKRYPENSLVDIMKAYAPDLEIKEYDFGTDSNYIKGAIKYADGGGPVILINHKRTRQENGANFTLAHEFGHYILHENMEKFRLDLVNYLENTVESKQESEANYFAASLLMPRNEFEDILKLTRDLDKIAAYFGVSKLAVSVRMKWLIQNKTN